MLDISRSEELLSEQLLSGRVTPDIPDRQYYRQVKERWDSVVKPLDSLGVFEDMTGRMGSILGTADLNLKRKAIIIMCADNGVVAEGVSQSGQEVTLAIAKAMGNHRSSVGKMAAVNGTRLIPIDIGINSREDIPGVMNRKIAYGTRNFAVEPAMSREEVCQAVQVGIDAVAMCKEEGYTLIGTGEMGIGNTTTSCAIATALLGCSEQELVGRGAGLSEEGLKRKRRVIRDAVQKYQLYDAEPLTVLRTVGGLDIAGLVGVILGGAYYHIPVVLDGVISAVAALAAVTMVPQAGHYIFPSHASRERAAGKVFEKLKLEPVIYGDMALGEGTGAVMLFSLLDAALALYYDRTTFEDVEIEAYTRKI